MRAIVVEAGETSWASVPTPEPGPGQLAIRVAATAVNRADLLQRAGTYPPPPGAPDTLGLECSGTVAALGPGASRFRVGDRVGALLAGGGYAEVAVCDERHALPLPDHVPLEVAAALPEALCTVWMALWDVGRLQPGERILLHAGASGIGTTAIRLACLRGHEVWVTVGTEDKLARCVALGAAGGAVRTEGPWAAALAARVPDGFDVIVDPVGQGYVEDDASALRIGGRIVLIGVLGGRAGTVDLGKLLTRRLTISGTVLRSRSADDKARIVAGVARDLWPAVADGSFAPVIHGVRPITEVDAAHAEVGANETVGKVVLTLPG